jgi:hypothetical protein
MAQHASASTTYVAGGEGAREVLLADAAQVARVDGLELLAELLNLREESEKTDKRAGLGTTPDARDSRR